MLQRKKNLDTSTSTVSVSSYDTDDNKEAGSREFSSFWFKWTGGFGIFIVLAWYNLFIPLPAKAADTSATRTLSSSIQALPRDQQQDQRSSSSQTRRPPIAVSRTKTLFRYDFSSRRLRLSDSRSLSGPTVRRFPRTKKGLGHLLCFNLNTEKKDKIENRVALQGDIFEAGKTAVEILEKMNEKDVTLIKNFLAMNQGQVTDKKLIPLVWETTAKLTDFTLNTREELEVLYPVMKSRLNYLGVEDSQFSKESNYNLLAQEIVCMRFLLNSDFHKSDSLVNRTSHSLKLYSGPFNQLPAQVNNEMPAQTLWPINLRDQWRHTFRKIKIATADQLEDFAEDGLGKQFEEEKADLYSITANICSIAPFYLVEKTAQAFQLFYDAHNADVEGVSSLENLLPKVNALIEDEDLDAYFDKNHKAFYKALSLEDSASSSNESLTLFQKIRQKKVGQRKYYHKKKQKGLLYPELQSIRAENNQLFELFVSDDLFI